MPESSHHELHETLAAEHGDDLHRHPVAPHHDRSVRHDAAERRITGADLLCYVDATAADGEAHVEAGRGEIAFALGELDRPKSGQYRRSRKQISDLFRRLRERGRGQRAEAECGTARHQQAAGYSRLTCGHLTLSRRLAPHNRRRHDLGGLPVCHYTP